MKPTIHQIGRILILAILIWPAISNAQTEAFNPKDLDNLEMFLESINDGLAIATNTSAAAYEATGENTPLDEIWSDKARFPHGTVRWWKDQSPYQNDKRLRANRVFKTGRDIGQDDHDRPGYIPDGCNGKPCVRGGLTGHPKGEKHNQQPCYFELQLESRDFKIDGPFGIFLLTRPVPQENDNALFGQFHHSVLIQSVEERCLKWKNMGKPMPLSGPDTLKLDEWQLLELHRDEQNALRCFIDGADVTPGPVKDERPFTFGCLFNHNKGQGFAGQDPYAGDIAAFIVYRDQLGDDEKRDVRNYLRTVYDLDLGRKP